jgi:hypothetical protein
LEKIDERYFQREFIPNDKPDSEAAWPFKWG